jgi:hypothetical protein
MHRTANKKQPGIPLPANVAAIWGGFLYQGLMSPDKHDQRLRAILDAWNQGCIELVIAASAHLPEIWQQITAKWDQEDEACEFPAVFEYEVVAPLGKFLGDYLLMSGGSLPELDRVQKKICQLIDEFFAQQTAPMSQSA